MNRAARVLRRFRPVFFVAGWGLLGACSDAVIPETTSGDFDDGCSLAVVHSDYISSSVSILRDDGSICADNIIHSGSASPGLVTALSGDVVVPSALLEEGVLALIDRYPNGVVSWLDAASGQITSQLSVATGFAANPQDIAAIDSTKAYVSRAERNPTPTAAPDDWDEGSDILIIDPTVPEITGRIDLQSYATELDGERLVARPGRFAVVGGFVWVVLENLSSDFRRGGPGIVLGIDPQTDSVMHQFELAAMKNCHSLTPTPDGTGLWGGCRGVFQEGEQAQIDASGLFFIDLSGDAPTVDMTVKAAALNGRPIAPGLAVASRDVVYYVATGSLTGDGLADLAYCFTRSTATVSDLGIEGGAFELGALHFHTASQSLLVPDANPTTPGIFRLDLSVSQNGTNLERITSSIAVGLPPRMIGVLR